MPINDNINQMIGELKTEISKLLFAFTDEYAAPDRRDTCPLVLPVMRKVLEESLDSVISQQGENPRSIEEILS
jgi:hypothetical protein